MLASTTTAKASLISKLEMSATDRPAIARARGMAIAGAVGKSIGAMAASAKPMLSVDC